MEMPEIAQFKELKKKTLKHQPILFGSSQNENIILNPHFKKIEKSRSNSAEKSEKSENAVRNIQLNSKGKLELTETQQNFRIEKQQVKSNTVSNSSVFEKSLQQNVRFSNNFLEMSK